MQHQSLQKSREKRNDRDTGKPGLEELGRVMISFVRLSDGSVSYQVTMGLGSTTTEEIINESEVEQRSPYGWRVHWKAPR